MKVGRTAAISDTGRRRRRNEDAFVCEPPLFALADGVGGAQAGEIASRLATVAVREGAGSDESPEARVTAAIQEANRRIYRRSSEDEATSGMSTTMTVALVHDGEVTIGHVGDSRAYLVRDNRLEQVTEDHSLVAELVRSGKLTPEEADTHPQRSVITRSVGSEPDVDVDVFSVPAEPGDLFLLCSDGLTDMVDDDTILTIVTRNRRDLDVAARALVNAANRGGGEDNITVVVFELVGDEETAETPVVAHAGAADEDTLSGAEALSAISVDGHELSREAWVEGERLPARRLSRRTLFVLGTVLALLAVAAAAGLYAISRAHFVGAETDGHVAVYQGVPWNLVGNLHLYRTVYVSPLLAAQLSQAERRRLFDHDLTSEATARAKVRRYEAEIVP